MIWGVSGGIGRAVAQELQTRGWTVIGIGRQPEDMASIASHTFTADVAREYDVQTAVHAASFEVDQVDLWIYAAGDIETTAVADFKLASWQRILDANLTGPFLTTKHSLPLLAEQAHLVYLGAVSERLKLPKFSAYVAAKAGTGSVCRRPAKRAARQKDHPGTARGRRHAVLGQAANPPTQRRCPARKSGQTHPGCV
jgi:NAD(P)-dependent dehydrogenase (short-subunit alcohol dehydrogenase family)